MLPVLRRLGDAHGFWVLLLLLPPLLTGVALFWVDRRLSGFVCFLVAGWIKS